jgi:hypothetical protein
VDEIGRKEISAAVVRAVRDIFGHIHRELTRPSVLYRPSLTLDGNQWRALYGPNPDDGIAGFGSTPEEAMREFDRAWIDTKSPPEVREDEDSNLRLVPKNN